LDDAKGLRAKCPICEGERVENNTWQVYGTVLENVGGLQQIRSRIVKIRFTKVRVWHEQGRMVDTRPYQHLLDAYVVDRARNDLYRVRANESFGV